VRLHPPSTEFFFNPGSFFGGGEEENRPFYKRWYVDLIFPLVVAYLVVVAHFAYCGIRLGIWRRKRSTAPGGGGANGANGSVEDGGGGEEPKPAAVVDARPDGAAARFAVDPAELARRTGARGHARRPAKGSSGQLSRPSGCARGSGGAGKSAAPAGPDLAPAAERE
jgi:hypothetical protein